MACSAATFTCQAAWIVWRLVSGRKGTPCDYYLGMSSDPSVLVSGDMVGDLHIYDGGPASLQDASPSGTRLFEEVGGAALTHKLIEAIFAADLTERRIKWEKDKKGPAPIAHESRLGCELVPKPETTSPQVTSYALWGPHPSKDKSQFWRLSKPLGYGSRGDNSHAAKSTTDRLSIAFRAPKTAQSSADVLVLDDAGGRFRHQEHADVWHLSDASRLPAWVVLKLSGEIGKGDLWDRLMAADPHQRLVVLLAASLLRKHEIRLSRGLSWERTVEHLSSELEHNPELQPLRAARHVIVSFGVDGGVWIDRSSDAPRRVVVFDSAQAEEEWASRIKGEAIGYHTCLTGAVAFSLASATGGTEPDLASAIERGLSAMRVLRERGHGLAISDNGVCKPGAGFPADALAAEILHPSHRFARATVPAAPADLSTWSVLTSLQRSTAAPKPLFGFARQLVLGGEHVFDHVPHLRIGQLLAAGRDEMETLRSLRRIFAAYRDLNPAKRPLCVGVFGAPGSGKSFGVEQLALGVFGELGQKKYDGWLEFNLSQFEDPGDLIGAFHQVRDRVLQGPVPVVFWDEFDSRAHHWLRFLLAPMQDGRFQEGQLTHALGKCVFVFAGGTSETFERFANAEGNSNLERELKLAKAPDFKSRLDGYLNVVGPNPSSQDDLLFPVRRGLMIRNILGCGPREQLDIDGGLLTALLEVPRYEHGARSLAKILEPFATARKAGRLPLRRSQLPAPNQLGIHTEPKPFHALCSRDTPFKSDAVVRVLAPAIHETWRQIAQKQGWKPNHDIPFDELPPDIKRSNVAAARRLPEIAALVGLKIVEGDGDRADIDAVRAHLARHLNLLAEEEHKGWMENAQSEGWKYGPVRDDGARIHNCIRPFHELDEIDKEKDRDSVKHYPDFVALAKCQLVFS